METKERKGINFYCSRSRPEKYRWAWLIALLATMLLSVDLFAGTIAKTVSSHYPKYPPAHIEAGADKAQIARGEYLVKLGDCMACHTAMEPPPLCVFVQHHTQTERVLQYPGRPFHRNVDETEDLNTCYLMLPCSLGNTYLQAIDASKESI